MGDDQDQREGFRVKDRRRFSETGERRETEPGEPPEGSPAQAEASAAPADVPPVTFSSFILGISTQALMHLGEVGDPEHGEGHRDLDAAKQVIDILGLLQAKTEGNLDDGERGLIENVLFDLRMRYVELTRKENS